jgi:hypothetical protein
LFLLFGLLFICNVDANVVGFYHVWSAETPNREAIEILKEQIHSMIATHTFNLTSNLFVSLVSHSPSLMEMMKDLFDNRRFSQSEPPKRPARSTPSRTADRLKLPTRPIRPHTRLPTRSIRPHTRLPTRPAVFHEQQSPEQHGQTRQVITEQQSPSQVLAGLLQERHSPERHVSELHAPEQHVVPERHSPERHVSELHAPEQHVVPERHSPARHVSELQMPKRHTPEQQIPEQQIPDRQRVLSAHQLLLKQRLLSAQQAISIHHAQSTQVPPTTPHESQPPSHSTTSTTTTTTTSKRNFPTITFSQTSIGYEPVTIKKLWDHCLANPNDIVWYLHNKGSFHPSGGNDLLRFLLLRYVLSSQCYDEVTSTRDACGMRFTDLPHRHFPGNMWIAKCSYIKLLPSPMIERGTPCNNGGKIIIGSTSTPCFAPTCLATGRFYIEHWIGFLIDGEISDCLRNAKFEYGESQQELAVAMSLYYKYKPQCTQFQPTQLSNTTFSHLCSRLNLRVDPLLYGTKLSRSAEE